MNSWLALCTLIVSLTVAQRYYEDENDYDGENFLK
jgi:hypothetical protein